MKDSQPADTSQAAPTASTTNASSHLERVRVLHGALAFRCTECGDCCRDWSIPTDTPFREDLDDRLSSAAGVRVHAFLQAPAEDSVQRDPVLRTIGGRCVFLADDNRCRLHEAYGPDAKPAACQTYPFRQIKLGGSSTVSLDLSCPAAAEMLVHPFPTEWIEYLRRTPGTAPTGGELIEGLPVGAHRLAALEDAVLSILRDADAMLDERLLAASLLLDDVLAEHDDDDADGDDDGDAPTVVDALHRDRDAATRHLIRRARSARAEPVRHYLFLSRLIDTIEQWLVAFDLPDGGAAWQTTRRLVQHFDLCANTHGIETRATRLGARLAAAWSARTADAEAVLANYCWQSIGARHLTAEHGLVTGFRVLLVHVALVRLHAAGLALGDRSVIGATQVIDAVRTVERNFAHLPLLSRFWKRTSIVNLLTQHRFAARALLLPEVEDGTCEEDHRLAS